MDAKPAPAEAGKEVTALFKELTEELLELSVVEKGYRGALYARNTHRGPCCACCTCCECWFWC